MSLDSTNAIAQSHLKRGDAQGWFDEVYRAHVDDVSQIPWNRAAPNDLMMSWLAGHPITGRACVVGCGLGDDAAELARRGLQVTAFDLSPTAAQLARERYPDLNVNWQAADLFALPAEWSHAFDFVFEAYTLQSMPAEMRRQAFLNVTDLVAPNGQLLVIARLRDASEPAPEGPPWPLTRAELGEALPDGLQIISDEEHAASERHPSRRIRVTYTRR